MHIQSKRGKSDVAFVKGANERNEFFEKNKQLCITIKSGRKRQNTNNLRDELIRG